MTKLKRRKSAPGRAKGRLTNREQDTEFNVGRNSFSMKQIVLLVALIVAVSFFVLAVHWPALSAKALSFDDNQYLLENQLVQNPGWSSTRRFFLEITEPSTVRGYYQPLAMISLMADYAMGGRPDNLLPFHVTSLFLHLINTSLVIVLLYMLFGNLWLAAMIGLLFGLHPMTVETIPWVSERKTLLASFFALWCLIIYVRYVRNRNWKLLTACLISFVLALMSKPTTTTLPVLLLLLDFWPLRRLSRRVLVEKIPLFVVALIFAFITVVSQGRTAAVAMPGQYSTSRIPLILCHNIIFYLYKILWPANLSSHYPFPSPLDISDGMILAGVIGTFLLIPLLLISLRWTPALLTGWLFFFVAIFPTMGVIGFTKVIASDKYAYLPSVGLLMVLAWFLRRLWNSAHRVVLCRATIVVVILVLAVSEAVATRGYLVCWQTTESLYRHMLLLAPDAYLVHNNFANELLAEGRLDEAIEHYSKALQVNPQYCTAHRNMGMALAEQGKFDEAIASFTEALRINPDWPEAYNSLGLAYARQGRYELAVQNFEKALQLNPRHSNAHYNMALAMTEQKEYDGAVAHFNEVLRIKPGFLEVRYQLGRVYYQQGKFDLAVEQLDILADAYAAAGKLPQAIEAAEKALKLAESSQQEHLAEQIRSRLRSYRASESRTGHESQQPFD